jgi:hypothetical protein
MEFYSNNKLHKHVRSGQHAQIQEISDASQQEFTEIPVMTSPRDHKDHKWFELFSPLGLSPLHLGRKVKIAYHESYDLFDRKVMPTIRYEHTVEIFERSMYFRAFSMGFNESKFALCRDARYHEANSSKEAGESFKPKPARQHDGAVTYNHSRMPSTSVTITLKTRRRVMTDRVQTRCSHRLSDVSQSKLLLLHY